MVACGVSELPISNDDSWTSPWCQCHIELYVVQLTSNIFRRLSYHHVAASAAAGDDYKCALSMIAVSRLQLQPRTKLLITSETERNLMDSINQRSVV